MVILASAVSQVRAVGEMKLVLPARVVVLLHPVLKILFLLHSGDKWEFDSIRCGFLE